MADLLDREEIEPGVYRETWHEDARIYWSYNDTRQKQRDDMRARLRDVHPKYRGDGWARGMGYIAPHERHLLEKRHPDLASKCPTEAYKAWKRFWQSSESERYRTVGQV